MKNIILERLTLENTRGLKYIDLELSSGNTTIIGENKAGKSTLPLLIANPGVIDFSNQASRIL